MEGKREEQLNRGLLEFIQDSPSVFHVIDNLKKRLEKAGFAERREQDSWELQPGGSYYVIRNGSSLIAFRLPEAAGPGKERPFRGYHIAAAHSDSPTFKVKALPETVAEKQYVRLNVEKYGGMILSTWLDRPLSVAGRVAVREPEGGVGTRLVNLDRDLLVIPNLAVHMNRDINSGYAYNPQADMLPLMGLWQGSRRKNPLPSLPRGCCFGRLPGNWGYAPRIYWMGICICMSGKKGGYWAGRGNLFSAPGWMICNVYMRGWKVLCLLYPGNMPMYWRCLTMRRWAAGPDRARIPHFWKMFCCGYRAAWAMDLPCTGSWWRTAF